MKSIDAYQSFFKDLKAKTAKLQGRRVAEDKAKFSTLLNSYSIFQSLITRLNNVEARSYNLFDIINVKHLEEKVHTPFIANLLDPKGSHAQGALFYNSFINLLTFETIKLFTFNCSDYSYLEVVAEKTAGIHGEIDILIYYNHPNERFAIIIENKIWASDQKDQLSRYYQYAIEYLKLSSDRVLLVYLTPFGSEASGYSINTSLAGELIHDNSLIFISYRQHIQHWLTNTLPLVKADKVKQTIVQYLDTIKIICNE